MIMYLFVCNDIEWFSVTESKDRFVKFSKEQINKRYNQMIIIQIIILDIFECQLTSN